MIKFGRKSGLEVTASIAQIAAELAEQKERQARIAKMQLAIVTLQQLFEPPCPAIAASISAYNVDHLQRLRFRYGDAPVKTARFTDGILLLGTSRGVLEDRSHQLTFRGDEVKYYGAATNTGYRESVSPELHLSGVEEIAANEIAYDAMAFFLAAVEKEATQKWPHAYHESVLALVSSHALAQA